MLNWHVLLLPVFHWRKILSDVMDFADRRSPDYSVCPGLSSGLNGVDRGGADGGGDADLHPRRVGFCHERQSSGMEFSLIGELRAIH